MSQKRFYVYTLAEPNDLVFYVGKGQGKRVHAHEKEAHTDCSCAKCERIRTIWAAGNEVKRTIVFETDNEADALQYERDLIAAIGRANLCNRTDGSEWGRRRAYAL